MNKTQIAEFESILRAERDCSEQMVEVLKRENEALKGQGPEALEAVNADKQTLLGLLNTHLKAHDQFLVHLGVTDARGGTEKILRNTESSANLHKVWSEVQGLAAECKRLNEINGGILALSRRQVEQSLSILRGNTGTSSVYGRSGQTKAVSNSHTLAKA